MAHDGNLAPPQKFINRAGSGPWWLRALARWAEGRSFCALARAGRRVGRWVFYLLPYRRYSVVRRNLLRTFPDLTRKERRAIALGAYESLGAAIFELLGAPNLARASTSDLDAVVTIEGREHLDAALSRNRGVILVTAHLAGFDLLACACARMVPALHVVTKHLSALALDAWWQETRASLGVHLHGPVGSASTLLAALRAGGCVALMIDQRMYVRDGGVAVPFFGILAETSPAPAVLAARARCPLVPARFIRDADGHHRVVLEPALEPPPPQREAWIAVTAALTARVEAWVREVPGQWLWLHDRWRRGPR